MNKKFLSYLFLIMTMIAGAQETAAPQMADALRQDGKIYIVITVIGLIFLALVFFLLYIERRVKKLEEELKK